MWNKFLSALIALANVITSHDGSSFLERLAGKAKIAGLDAWVELIAGLPRMLKMTVELAAEYAINDGGAKEAKPLKMEVGNPVGAAQAAVKQALGSPPAGQVGPAPSSHPDAGGEGVPFPQRNAAVEGPPSHPDQGNGVVIPEHRIPEP